MELDLIHQDGESWSTVAGRIRGATCRELALSEDARRACEGCFRETSARAVSKRGFQTASCHAGLRFSVCSLGDCGGRKLLLLAGRVRLSEMGEGTPGAAGRVPAKSPVEYDAALQLIELSLPYLTSRLKVESFDVERRLSPVVRRACRFIDHHYRDKLSLDRVARACRVSKDHLSHLFSQQTGRPLVRYISAVRIGHALYLLGKTDMDITQICFEVGYQSVSQFNRAFRALKGMSPSHYRKTLAA